MDMLGPLTNHLWQTTWFAVAVWLLTLAFRRNRAKVRYRLWLAASIKFLVPFWLLISAGRNLGWAPPVREIGSQVTVPLAIAQIGEPFPDIDLPARPTQGTPDWAGIAVLAVWALGFAAIALKRFGGWRSIRAALRASVPAGIAAPVEVRFCPGLLEPGVVGLVRPILLLPRGIGERLTPEQLAAVLAHELCHVRCRDNLWAAVHMAIEAVFWFHPAVWWIGARLLEERERACDEEVLGLGGEPRVYAEGILNVCKLYVESPLGCVSGVTGANLKKRIEAIMTNRISLKLNVAKKTVLAVAAISALAVPIGIGMLNAARGRAQSAPAGTPKFESVSIQPGCVETGGVPRKSRDGDAKMGPPLLPSPEKLTLNCTNVAQLITSAYGLYASGRPVEEGNLLQIVGAVPLSGGPAWIYRDRYHIEAKAAGEPGQEMMQGPMMQALLEDRFKLRLRRETRDSPAYALTIADGGPKMKPFLGDCVSSVFAPLPPGQKRCWEIGMGERKEPNFTPHFQPDRQVRSLDDFCVWLFAITQQPVLNKTGLAGKFFTNLMFAPDQATPGALNRMAIVARREGRDPAAELARSNPPGPSLFTAIEQQLGLKLEPTTAPRDFLFVDYAEKPGPN